jgi:hypothetical protein
MVFSKKNTQYNLDARNMNTEVLVVGASFVQREKILLTGG